MVDYQFVDAVISECEEYRYNLERTWDDRKEAVAFLMLNPRRLTGWLTTPPSAAASGSRSARASAGSGS